MIKYFWILRAMFWLFVKTKFNIPFRAAFDISLTSWDYCNGGYYTPKDSVEEEMSYWNE